jgi:hypothetical protein
MRDIISQKNSQVMSQAESLSRWVLEYPDALAAA